MPLMKLGKNRVYASTLGHAIRFVKDEPVNVPPICVRECESIGAAFIGKTPEGHVNEDELAEQIAATINKGKRQVSQSVEDAKKAENISPEIPITQPTEPADRMGVIIKSIRDISDRNERGDFTAAGSVNLKVLARHTGFRVDKSEYTEAMAIINDPD
jgi:hypothetical protein